MADMLAAFFDLDGCLVDSRVPITEAINAGLAAVSLPPQPAERLIRFIGPPLHASFEQLLRELGADPDRADDALAGYRAVYGELAVTKTVVVPGMRALLDRLVGRLELAVVTSKPPVFAEPILDALDLRDHFRAVFGPSLTALTEPKSAKLRAAIELVGLRDDQLARSAMIGDREHDVAAGRACRVTTIGVTWGVGDRAELVRAGADVIVDEPAQLAPLLLDPTG